MPEQAGLTPPLAHDATFCLVIRVWRDGETEVRGHVATISGERIGAFSSIDGLVGLLRRTLQDRVKFIDRKD